MINGADDRVVPADSVRTLVEKLKTQRGIVISHETVEGANHFFEDRIDDMMIAINKYLDHRFDPSNKLAPPSRTKSPPPPVEDDGDEEE
jgi:alpha/beta superfamily hydrolase